MQDVQRWSLSVLLPLQWPVSLKSQPGFWLSHPTTSPFKQVIKAFLPLSPHHSWRLSLHCNHSWSLSPLKILMNKAGVKWGSLSPCRLFSWAVASISERDAPPGSQTVSGELTEVSVREGCGTLRNLRKSLKCSVAPALL